MTVSNLLEQPCNKSDNINKVVTSCQQLVPHLLTTWEQEYEHNLLADLLQDVRFLRDFGGFFNHLRACSYGQKLSRLARKLFDKFTSEISPCYENNMKNYIAFI